jgi:hypothetical protein
MKRTGFKILTGATSTYIHGASGNLQDAIDVRIQKYLKEGWVLKGEMTRAHPTSTVWCQIIEKYT